MAESLVLFLDGPLEGEWRDIPNVVETFHHVQVEFDPPTMHLASDANLEKVSVIRKPLVYVITKVIIFDKWLRVAHAGDDKSRTDGMLTYLVPSEVRANLQSS
jgi:type IV secretory pathway VirB6-like protein